MEAPSEDSLSRDLPAVASEGDLRLLELCLIRGNVVSVDQRLPQSKQPLCSDSQYQGVHPSRNVTANLPPVFDANGTLL
jgi:hypothetical protein